MRVVRITGPVVDASTPISRATARGIRAAGKLAVVRCYAFPNAKEAEPTRAELDVLLGEGLGVALYAFWRARGHSAETGAADAVRQLALLDALGWPRDAPAWVDLEAHEVPSAEAARAYAEALSEAYAAVGRPRMAYLDASFARSGADVRDLFDEWWESGASPRYVPGAKLPKAYVMRQHANPPGASAVFVAGHPVDLNDADGAPFLAREETATVTTPTNKYAFRAVVRGETEAARYCRMLEEILRAGQSTALLEKGVSLGQSTCMIVARAAEWHARSLPEDGSAVKRQAVTTDNGKSAWVDYGDYGAEMHTGENYIDFGIRYPAQAAGAWCEPTTVVREGGVARIVTNPEYAAGPTRGCTLYVRMPGVPNSEHVVNVTRVVSVSREAFVVETIEGGQYPVHVGAFTRTFVWDKRKGWCSGSTSGKVVRGWQIRSDSIAAGHPKAHWPYPDSTLPTLPEVQEVPPPSVPPAPPEPQSAPVAPVVPAPPTSKTATRGALVGVAMALLFGVWTLAARTCDRAPSASDAGAIDGGAAPE